MSKHTPGPWEVISDHDWHSGCKFGVDGVVPVNHTITEANARLIAAAPDLLKALIDFLDDPMGNPEPCRKAITKALGKS